MNTRRIQQSILVRPPEESKSGPLWEDVDQTTRAKYLDIADPVGLITFRGTSLCSGFLTGSQTFMTAGHCDLMEMCRENYDEYGASHYRVVFGYDQVEGTKPAPRSYTVKEIKGFEKCDDSHDVALFKLSSDAASKYFGRLDFQQRYTQEQDIVVAHHPEGQTKKLSFGKIVGFNPQRGLFAHTADTLGGSSGAPVVSDRSKKVVGLHVEGGDTVNHALPATTVLAALRRR